MALESILFPFLFEGAALSEIYLPLQHTSLIALCSCLLASSQHGWQVKDRSILFQTEDQAAAGKEGPPPLKLVNNALMYAKELERIV